MNKHVGFNPPELCECCEKYNQYRNGLCWNCWIDGQERRGEERHDGTLFSTNELERFYVIAFERGRSLEREECAKVCEDAEPVFDGYGHQCAKAIRARSTK